MKFFRIKQKFQYRLIVAMLALVVVSLSGIIAHYARAAEAYYFNNAINTDPTELGNYWFDTDFTIQATQLPTSGESEVHIVTGATHLGDITFGDFSTNEGTITGTATFLLSSVNNGTVSGNANFYDTSVNNGTVTGDATFYEDSPENAGTVTGAKIRRYNASTSTSRDFVATGPWTVMADGVTLNAFDATVDNTTTYATANGGSFLSLIPSSAILTGGILVLTYDIPLNSSSVPVAGDYSVSVNGSAASVSAVAISGATVRLTVTGGQALTSTDTIQVDYTPGATPVQASGGYPATSLNDRAAIVAIPVGSSPIFPALVGTKLYILNSGSDNVTVINTITNTVVATISVGDSPFTAAGVGNKLYVTNANSNNVSVINTATDTVTATISVGSQPYSTNIIGTKIYVTNGGADTVSVINTSTDTVTSTVSVGDQPNYANVLGSKLYVNDRLSNTVSVIDSQTDTVTATIPVASGPYFSTNAGTKIYVNGAAADTVSVIDTLTDTVVATIPVGDNPNFSATIGTKVYVDNRNASTVSVIDTASDTVIETISVGSTGSFMTAVNAKVFVTNSADDTVSVINTATDTVVATLTSGDTPYFPSVVGNKVYVINSSGGNVYFYDSKTLPSELPNLVSFTSTTASGTYTVGQGINITATFGRSLQAGSTMTVLLNTGDSVVLNNVSGATLTGTYTVGAGDTTADLAVTSVTSASVTDSTATYTKTSYSMPSAQGSLVAENSFITSNIGDTKNIVIGTYATAATGTNPYQISTPVTVGGVRYVYVANQGADTVSVVRLTDNTVVDTISVGSEPYGLVPVEVSGTTYIYVANIGSGTVSVIDTSDNSIEATITAGVKPYYATAIGTTVYVTNGASNTVSVINAATNTVTATIAVGSYPRGIKAHGTDLYVANYGDPNYGGGDSISVIDSTDNTVSETIMLPIGSGGPRGVTVLGDYVYVTNYRTNNVSVIDTADNSIVATIAVGAGPRGIAGLGSYMYVENFDDGTVSIIDTADNTVDSTVKVGHSPSGMGVVGTDIYISRFQDNLMSILDTVTGTLRTAFAAPTATTSAASSVTQTAATLNGSFSSTGGEDGTSRGFEYGTTTIYGTTVSEAGIYRSTDSFTTSLSSLTCGTTYHFRSFVTNSTGTGTSSDDTFSTSACASSGGGGGSSGGGAIYAPVPPTPAPNPTPTPNPDPSQNPDQNQPTTPEEIKALFVKKYPNIAAAKGNLSVGAKGQAVLELQKYLNANGFIVAKSGAGSPGKETNFFGKATKAALIKFQEAHAKEILVPTKLKKGTGTFGPATKAYIMSH